MNIQAIAEYAYQPVKAGEYYRKGDSLVQLDKVRYSAVRGWIVSVRYVPGGGGSFWWNVDELSPATSLEDKLIINKHQSQAKIARAKKELAEAEHRLECIQHVQAF